MYKACRFSVALIAPLLISGCGGLPIGLQMASILADGVSMITTDKTLADHGLSAITSKDCILWRSVKGEDICQDPDNTFKHLANTKITPSNASMDIQEHEPNIWNHPESNIDKKNIFWKQTGEFPIEEPAALVFVAPLRIKPSLEISALKPMASGPPIDLDTIIPDAPAAQIAFLPAKNFIKLAGVTTQAPSEAKPTSRERYFVIASFHQKTFATRFSKRHKALRPTILKGTANGKLVYRIAIGPVPRHERKTTKQSLVKEGFAETWELALKKSNVELAALP